MALLIAVGSLGVGLYVLWGLNGRGNDALPSGVKEIELFKDVRLKVSFGSDDYYLSLFYFTDINTVIELKVETSYGSSIVNLYFSKASIAKDLRIMLKERRFDSVVLWVEQT